MYVDGGRCCRWKNCQPFACVDGHKRVYEWESVSAFEWVSVAWVAAAFNYLKKYYVIILSPIFFFLLFFAFLSVRFLRFWYSHLASISDIFVLRFNSLLVHLLIEMAASCVTGIHALTQSLLIYFLCFQFSSFAICEQNEQTTKKRENFTSHVTVYRDRKTGQRL